MKKLSVLVPVYNVEKYIKRCVDSLKNQTYKNLEIIFVDDCSTDNSLKVLQEEIKDMPNAKILQHDENKGLFLARLTALLDCTGDYIAFLDSDDYVDHNFYEIYAKKLMVTDADMCVCDFQELDYNNKKLINLRHFKGEINLKNEQCFEFFCKPQIMKSGLVTLWRKIINRRVFEKAKPQLMNIANEANHIVGGEDTLYTTIFCAYTQSVVSEYGPKLYYCKHVGQSVDFSQQKHFLSQVESHIRCSLILRRFTTDIGLYNKYVSFDNIYLSAILSFKIQAFKNNCIKEFDDLLNKYNIYKIANIVSFADKTFNE